MPDAARLLLIAQRLQARAQPPRPMDLVPLVLAGHSVGWVAPKVAAALAERFGRFLRRSGMLYLDDDDLDAAGRSALLHDAALWLREAGLVRGWRNEMLAVRSPSNGAELAVIERAACRTLGITTTAVHLNAFADDGTLMVARRASHKAIDPGLWDNLVGGMVPAAESLEQALEREAWEEAGLALDRLEVHHGRSFHVRRPVVEGYQSERVHVFETTLAADTPCVNQDGEVAAIERRALPAVVEAIEREQFTLESALATLESLTRRGGFAAPAGLFE
jgi:8-oxo-dGTP pyrophosphatase MutT (NUDIX family)